MKLATFNVNGINRRLGNLLDWLADAKPDVVCLQELKAVDADFPAEAIRAAGYASIWLGQKSWNGVAILARGNAEPVLTRRGLPGDPADAQSRYLEAAVRGVLVGCLYLPNGNPWPGPKFDYKLAWLERLIGHAATLRATGLPVALAGDFNVVPTDADIYPSKSWGKNALLQPESRAAFRRLLDQGWADAIRARHPDAPMYTFWDTMRDRWARDAGLRIDHLLLSPALASRLVDAGVDREVRGRDNASDHAPAWATVGPALTPRLPDGGKFATSRNAGRRRSKEINPMSVSAVSSTAAPSQASEPKTSAPKSAPAPAPAGPPAHAPHRGGKVHKHA